MKIIMTMAITADGKIGKSRDHLADWTSKEDKKLFVRLTKEAGVVIMGRTTYETIGKPLKDRLNVVLTSTPEKFEDIEGSLIFMKAEKAEDVIEKIQNLGYDKAVLGAGARINDLFLKDNAVDEIYLTIEPLIFGSGLCLAEELDLNVPLKLNDIQKLNDNTINLHYSVIKES